MRAHGVRRGFGGATVLEGWTGAPTDDQLYTLRRAEERAPELIAGINGLIPDARALQAA